MTCKKHPWLIWLELAAGIARIQFEEELAANGVTLPLIWFDWAYHKTRTSHNITDGTGIIHMKHVKTGQDPHLIDPWIIDSYRARYGTGRVMANSLWPYRNHSRIDDVISFLPTIATRLYIANDDFEQKWSIWWRVVKAHLDAGTLPKKLVQRVTNRWMTLPLITLQRYLTPETAVKGNWWSDAVSEYLEPFQRLEREIKEVRAQPDWTNTNSRDLNTLLKQSEPSWELLRYGNVAWMANENNRCYNHPNFPEALKLPTSKRIMRDNIRWAHATAEGLIAVVRDFTSSAGGRMGMRKIVNQELKPALVDILTRHGWSWARSPEEMKAAGKYFRNCMGRYWHGSYTLDSSATVVIWNDELSVELCYTRRKEWFISQCKTFANEERDPSQSLLDVVKEMNQHDAEDLLNKVQYVKA